MPDDFLPQLRWRALLHQCTDEVALSAHLRAAVRRAYAGFDPTADSLTIGNLVPIQMLAHCQRAGHTPVVVMGGGTGLIGDPSGKSEERQLRSREEVDANVRAQRKIFERILDFSPAVSNRAMLADNADWLCRLGYLEALRDIGKHFSVNMMIQKDSVRERLSARDQGISYTEFSYMILQAYDFAHLHRDLGVTVQLGGSDQWGNIVAGIDLVRRISTSADRDAFGLTAPLVTKADGGKFGKTESGAIWLTPERTSPYAYYQFWLNAADADAVRFLRIFTFLEEPEILQLEAEAVRDPGARPAQRALARHATELLHGATERQAAEAAAAALFSGRVRDLPESILLEALAAAPCTRHDKAALAAGLPLVDLLPQTTLAKSKSEARTLLQQGSISINGEPAAADARLETAALLHGRLIALRRGKKSWHLTRWE